MLSLNLVLIFIQQVVDDVEVNEYDIRPMDEAELSKQLKASTEKVDIYDTGMYEEIIVILVVAI